MPLFARHASYIGADAVVTDDFVFSLPQSVSEVSTHLPSNVNPSQVSMSLVLHSFASLCEMPDCFAQSREEKKNQSRKESVPFRNSQLGATFRRMESLVDIQE